MCVKYGKRGAPSRRLHPSSHDEALVLLPQARHPRPHSTELQTHPAGLLTHLGGIPSPAPRPHTSPGRGQGHHRELTTPVPRPPAVAVVPLRHAAAALTTPPSATAAVSPLPLPSPRGRNRTIIALVVDLAAGLHPHVGPHPPATPAASPHLYPPAAHHHPHPLALRPQPRPSTTKCSGDSGTLASSQTARPYASRRSQTGTSW